VTRDYAYFLENRLRARYGMDGVPLVIDFVERGQRGREASGREDVAKRKTREKLPDLLAPYSLSTFRLRPWSDSRTHEPAS